MVRRLLGAFALVMLSAVVSLSPTLLADTSLDRFDGRPTFSEGKALGYFIWKDGDTWKVRWTTFGAEHRFTGRINVEGGQFTSMKRIDADTERKIIAPGRAPHVVRGPRGRVRGVAPGRGAVVASREEDHIEQESEQVIRFATRTNDDIDGVDFKVGDRVEVLRFFLQIDGSPRPAEVEVGRNFVPRESPIVVRLR